MIAHRARKESSLSQLGSTFNDGPQRQKIEGIVEVPPDIRVAIFTSHFVKETVDGGSITALMIASQQRYFIWMLHLQ